MVLIIVLKTALALICILFALFICKNFESDPFPFNQPDKKILATKRYKIKSGTGLFLIIFGCFLAALSISFEQFSVSRGTLIGTVIAGIGVAIKIIAFNTATVDSLLNKEKERRDEL